jgi:tetratricopeptide (TPR) repeat protein
METKTFKAKTTKEALSRVSRELGPDAIIISQKKGRDSQGNLWAEVIAAPLDKGDTAPEAAPTFRHFLLKNKVVIAAGLGGLIVIGLLIVAASAFWPRAEEETVPVLAPGEMPRLAVLYFENGTGKEELNHWSTSIATLLTNDLAQSKYIRVVGSDRVYEILAELDQLDAQSFSSRILARVATMVKASHVVTGRFMKAGDRFVLTMQLHQASSGNLISTERAEGNGEESIFTSVDDLTRKIKMNLDFDEKKIDSDIDDSIMYITTDSPDALKCYVEAERYFVRGEYYRAIQLLERAVAIDPEFAEAYRTIGVAYDNMGNHLKAYEYWLKAQKYSNRVSIYERHWINAYVYYSSAKTMNKTIESLQEVLKIYPDDFYTLHFAGYTYLELEDWESATEYFSRAYRIAPDSKWPWALAQLAFAYESLGQEDKAEKHFQLLKETFPNDWRIYISRYRHYVRLNDLYRAEIEGNRALELGPMYGTSFVKPNVALWKEDLEESERLFKGLISNENLKVQNGGREGVVVILTTRGMIKEALTQYQPVLEIKNKLSITPVRTHQTFARLHSLIGEYGKAAQCLDSALEYVESLPIVVQDDYNDKLWTLQMQGECMLNQDRTGETLAAAEKLHSEIEEQHNPKQMRLYHLLLGKIALKEGDIAEAINQFRQAISLMPEKKDLPEFAFYLGQAYFADGDLEKAVEQFERVINNLIGRLYYPDLYPRSLYMLGKLYQAQRKVHKALEYYEKFLSYWGNADPKLKGPNDARTQLSILKVNRQ